MNKLEGFLFDIDGVLVRGAVPLRGAVEALVELRRRGYRLGYITNENETTRVACVDKIAPHGFPVTVQTMMTAGAIAAHYARTELRDCPVLVIGSPALVDAFVDAGVDVVPLERADSARAVVMGKDLQFDYAKLTVAARTVARLGAFFATNLDARMPVDGGFVPATGAMVMAVAYAAGVQPTVLGKPSRLAGQMSADLLGLRTSRIAMVGDSPAQDIAMGNAAGMTTILVLSGVTHSEDLPALSPEQRPDVVLERVADLPRWLDDVIALQSSKVQR